MTSPMDAGLMGQRVGMGQNGTIQTNVGGMGQGGGMGYDNPQPQNMYPPMQPPIPTAQPMGQMYQQPMGDESPMDSFHKKWFNEGQGQGAPQQQPIPNAPNVQPQQQPAPPENSGLDLSNLTAQQFQSLASQMDFTQGIPDEIMDMFKPDENGMQPNLMQGLMAMMNHVGRGVYSQSLAGGGRLAGHGLNQFGERFTRELPNHLQKQQASALIKSMKVPAALKPSVEGMVNHLLATNPNATTEQLQEMLEEFMGMFGASGQRNGPRGQQSQGIGDLFSNI